MRVMFNCTMKARNDFLYLVSSQCYPIHHDHYHRHAHSTYRRPAAKIQFQSLVTEGNSWLYEFSQRHVSMSVSSTCCVLFFLSQVQCHCPRESSGRCSSHASLSFWRVVANMYRDSCYVIIGTWIFFSTCRPLSLTNWTIVSGY